MIRWPRWLSPDHRTTLTLPSLGAQHKHCPFTGRGLNILWEEIKRANRPEWQYADMATAFGWSADPRAQSGQEGFDGVHVCCTAKPFTLLLPGMQQHADSKSGGNGRLELVQACVDGGDDEGGEGDDEDARKLVHEVLATALRERTGSAAPAHRAKAAKQELSAEIMWPPLLLIKGMAVCGPACGTSCSHSNSSSKLMTRFGDFKPALAAPEFLPRFMGNAVLGFRADNFEQATRLKDHVNSDSNAAGLYRHLTSVTASRRARIAAPRPGGAVQPASELSRCARSTTRHYRCAQRRVGR